MQDGINIHITRKMMIIGSIVLATIIIGGVTIFGIKAQNDSNTSGETDLGDSEPTEDSNAVETTVNSESLVVTVAPSETTSSLSTSETSGETKYDYTAIIENAVECYGFAELTPDQQAEIKKYEAMSINEYQALTQAEQNKFSKWFFENYKGRFEFILKSKEIDLSYTDNPTTPQEYCDNYSYITLMASSIVTNSQKDDGTYTGNKTDVLTGQKLLSLRDTSTKVHNEANNSYINLFNGNAIIANLDISVTGYEFTETGIVLNMHQNSTENVVVEGDTQDTQNVLERYTFTDINGKEITIMLCNLSITLEDPRVIEVTPVE